MKRFVDEPMIQDYLLGILPQAEMQRLDELSLTDDDFAARLDAAECDLVDSYVRGELSAETVDSFKSNYLVSPRRREKVTFARTFQERLSQESSPNANVSWKSRASRWFSVPGFSLQWGFAAAALLLFLAGGYLVLNNVRLQKRLKETQAQMKQREQLWQNRMSQRRSPRGRFDLERARMQEKINGLERQLAERGTLDEIEPSQPVKLLAFHLAPQTRGLSKIPALIIPRQTDFVSFTLELEVNEFPVYQGLLKNPANGEILWRSGKIKADDASSTIMVAVPGNVLTPQNYLLELSGMAANGISEIVSGYPFRVVTK